MSSSPAIIILAGPNGAGKTTISREVLANTLGITEFVNADVIAAGLSGFDPDRAAFAAGRIMLARLRELAEAKASFAFESTLASRTFAPWLVRQKARGYEIHVVYSWLRHPELAVRRVKARVSRGGHHVPAEVVTRRYYRSISNFWKLYRPLAIRWLILDNSGSSVSWIADGSETTTRAIFDRGRFAKFQELADASAKDSGDDH